MKLKNLLTEFLEYLEIERNRSQKTIENYHHYLKRFLAWAKISEPKDITAELIRSYRLYLNRQKDSHGKELKKVTQNYHIIAIRSFLKYLAKRDIKSLAAEKLEVGKNPSHEIEFLDSGELDRLLHAADGSDIKSMRDKES